MAASKLKFRPYHPQDLPILQGLMLSLYESEPGVMTKTKIRRTIQEFTRHPDKGQVMVFTTLQGRQLAEVIGYAILIHFWSNEYGHNVVIIDELVVSESFRSRGVATAFVRYLMQTRYQRSAVLELEVNPGNAGARRLYERLGFRPHKNNVLTLELKNNLGKTSKLLNSRSSRPLAKY